MGVAGMQGQAFVGELVTRLGEVRQHGGAQGGGHTAVVHGQHDQRFIAGPAQGQGLGVDGHGHAFVRSGATAVAAQAYGEVGRDVEFGNTRLPFGGSAACQQGQHGQEGEFREFQPHG